MTLSGILPSTSYIKMMDWWMLGSLVFTFTEVILFVLINKLENSNKEICINSMVSFSNHIVSPPVCLSVSILSLAVFSYMHKKIQMISFKFSFIAILCFYLTV